MKPLVQQAPWRRIAADIALLVALGLFMGAVGPFGSDAMPAAARYSYWTACIVGGGVIGIIIDESLGLRLGAFWRRVGAVSLLMTPFVAAYVILIPGQMYAQPFEPPHFPHLLWQVLVISLLVMSVRALVWRRPRTVVETRVVVAPPLPEAEAAFRRRLSARRRAARLIAIEAHDHYLRVHTDAGPDLVTLRFADALAELAGAHGLQVHRSWWVAADAIEAVRWRRGAGEARLAGGLSVPVSRSHAPALKSAGWF
ncbi:MAG: LytTR family DNA-binding domain-containing protein [Phenylobacterium sp.]|uniref:LytTR family DNA-binding domain-containing protein n=1 Tax=Phenylobacterium sp. TaxID=1871053 RepID=UPI0027359A55|nr:LytTR family DNA-binding domain-containing protein [Phenylobacterium sp.]MDP3747947.1 LytTR family DNA-binding domain-containing protein [Phenylobacterium sp.]